MPSSFRPLHPRHSLRRLRTAFERPDASSRSPTSSASSSPMSPLPPSPGTSCTRLCGFSLSRFSSASLHSAYSGRIIRRKKSVAEIEQEEERLFFDDALTGVVEPRPYAGAALGGIEEVFQGMI